MSTLFKCSTCGGTYADTQPDGTLYFHVCNTVPGPDPGTFLERPLKRDENIALDKAGEVTGIKAAGKGTVNLTTGKTADPAWLTTLNTDLAQP